MTDADPLPEALKALEAACRDFGMPVLQAIREKTDELIIRLFLKCIPDERLKDAQVAEFLLEVLGRKPSPDLLDAVAETRRGSRPGDDELIELERSQSGRCAMCGCFLVPTAGPQVDHITPVALRGKNILSNYQLLCQRCNQGKKHLVGWIMGAPFLYDTQSTISMKLRYCVLARDKSACRLRDCDATARNSELRVVPIIPVSRGGRHIFDNLMVLCLEHADERERELLESAKKRVLFSKYQTKLLGLVTLAPSS